MPRPDWAHSAQTRAIPQHQPAAPSEPAAAMEGRGDERSPLFHNYWITLKNELLAGYDCSTVRARPRMSSLARRIYACRLLLWSRHLLPTLHKPSPCRAALVLRSGVCGIRMAEGSQASPF